MFTKERHHRAGLAPLVLLLGLPATGCVVGQTLPLEHVAASPEAIGEGRPVAVEVEDRRPYVVSGDKAATFVGKYRGGFGNPWDVNTQSGEPLATVLRRDLAEQAEAMGFVVTPGAEPTLRVGIREWNLDAYQNGRFWCELDVSVRSRDGSELARDRVSYEHYLKGSFWTGGKAGAEREMPTAYGKVIDQVLTANATIRAALAPPH